MVVERVDTVVAAVGSVVRSAGLVEQTDLNVVGAITLVHANRRGRTTETAGANGKSLSALIDEGEQLRATLREVLSRTNALVIGLKRQRQQSNAMRTALKSLRAMQAIEV